MLYNLKLKKSAMSAATLFVKEFHFYGNQFSGSRSAETMLHYTLLELKRKNIELKRMNFFLFNNVSLWYPIFIMSVLLFSFFFLF